MACNDICGKKIGKGIFYAQCGKRIRSTCAGVRMVTEKVSRNSACRKCEGSIGERLDQEYSM